MNLKVAVPLVDGLNKFTEYHACLARIGDTRGENLV